MEDAAALARRGAPHGTVVLADHQTAGRGRRGRAWHAAPGQSLLLSLVWREGPAETWPRALLGLALATAEALDTLDLAPTLKWPNDVRLSGRKVAGMIAQTAGDALVLGVGVNVAQTSFPDDLAAPATSVSLEAGRPIPRGAVLAALLDAADVRLAEAVAPDPAPLLAAYRARLDGLGQPVRLGAGDTVHAGTFADVANDGALVLLHADGTRTHHHAGDVTLRPFPLTPHPEA